MGTRSIVVPGFDYSWRVLGTGFNYRCVFVTGFARCVLVAGVAGFDHNTSSAVHASASVAFG